VWRATQERPSPVPSWAPPWLPWPGRPTAVSALSWARLRAAASATAEVGRLRLPALVAGEAHRSRQRALCWGLQMYVVARGVGPSAMLAYEYLTDRASADTAGSTCLSWWFSLAPLLPDPPLTALTRRYVAEVAAVRGLRQPLVARSALASLDALAHQTLPRLRRSSPRILSRRLVSCWPWEPSEVGAGSARRLTPRWVSGTRPRSRRPTPSFCSC